MLSLLKSRLFLVGQGLVMLIVLVVILGRIIPLSPFTQLLLIIGILVIGMVMLLVGFIRANKSASAIQNSIRSQAEQQRQSVRPDNQAEIEQLQHDLEDAIERLKHSKLGGGRSGKSALYALPWYMIIGPPAAGKTTAIANSGLNFPIGMEAFRGVGGTRNCDWFFSDSAIFLDTAGRYMTEQEDAEEWNTFLDTLKEHRRRQPVNGIMVAISISDLADATPDQIEWHASTIRRRIDDLVARLDVTFPIYLVFTKCDLLRGFTQFFGALTRKEREQILGCTLKRNWEEDASLRSLFESEFDQISSALLNWRNEGLGLSLKREDRHLVYVFPLEFASVKDKLTRFVTMLFQPNPYRDTPEFRGFYFTSGTQEGLPIDRVIKAIGARFGFQPTSVDVAQPVTETKAYFIKDVFEQVIIPDRYLVSKTTRAAVRNRFMKSGVAAFSLIVLVLFVLGSTQAVIRSSSRLGDVRVASTAVAGVALDRPDISEEDLNSLESLQTLIMGLTKGASFGWGLDRGSNVREPARSVLFDKFREYMTANLFPLLRERMLATLNLPFVDVSAKDSLEEDAKAYLLLTSYTAELDSTANVDFLKRRLRTISADSPAGRDQRFQAVLDAYVDGLADGSTEGFAADTRLVESVTRVLTEEVNATRLYNKLKRDSEDALGSFTLADFVPSYASYFSGNPTISKFYTVEEWNASVEQRIADYSAAPVRDAWVPWAVDAPQVNTAEIEKQLTTLYFRDYRNAWQEFLERVRFGPFRNLREAATRLKTLSDIDDSPILWLLFRVSSQTTFQRGLLQDGVQQLAGSDQEPQNDVERYFRPLHQLNVSQSGDQGEALVRAIGALRSVADDMESLAGDEAGSIEYALEVLQDRGGQLGNYRDAMLTSMANQASEVRENLFEQPVLLAWAALVNSVQENLEDQWVEDVYDPYHARLEGKFPLGDNEDAPIRDFEEYFRPGGRGDVSGFLDRELSRFLQPNRLEPLRWQGRGVNVSSATRTALERVQMLQDVLYEGENLRWNFTLVPDLPDKPSSVSAISYYLNIHGSTQLYEMTNPPSLSVSWPGDADVTLRVSLTNAELPPRRFTGDWALFKFLSAAEQIRRSSTEYDLKWDMTGNVKAVYHANVQRSDNPFSIPNLFDITIPARLGD